jgi:aryl-alcohol dehydrogenase-like predicted oxidoreductase
MARTVLTAALPVHPLGKSDLRITRVGFGAWAVGGDWAFGWGRQDDADSIAAIRHAVSKGVNWIDTAAIYGLGHSEEVVAEALREVPRSDRPLIFTKCGLIGNPRDPMASPRRVGAAESIRREVEGSLKRLGVERIDLYQMQWPAEDGTPVDAYWQTLLDLKSEGKVRAVGLSNHSVAQLERAEKLGHVDSLQPPFSAINREAGSDVLPWCREHATGVIVYSPMQSGLLSGAFSEERAAKLAPTDWRRRSADFSGEGLKRNLQLAESLKTVARVHSTTIAAVAVAWTLAWPATTGAIVGARTPQQVEGWIEAATLELTDTDMAEIATAIEKSGAGVGPTMPVRHVRTGRPIPTAVE